MALEKAMHSMWLDIEDVNHYGSHVFVRFTDGRSVVLTGKEILDASQRAGRTPDEERKPCKGTPWMEE